MKGVSRRTVLALAAGGLASTGLAYAAVRSFSELEMVRATLERYLGNLNISDDHLRAFVLEFRRRNPWDFPTGKLADATTLFEKLHIGDMARPLLPEDPAHRLERFERLLLADFHLLTDYVWRRGPDDPITYSGSQLCVNPFANFEAA
ncbi:hypothetical protein [Sinorhizobium alkalisoli]|uniref:Uncharacterized protein n=1 Tax=Sinorhizobium alkalisoli TaxID=1752398 RepID=A0A1E3VGM5_9HYPH|nr:hypothetical protein [Sinorhizobium alkalisoli]MCG5478504.1 hypothetical protein [Sinorhizobium alkalisoli]ODR92739.1 hypothetical protein A8M32_03500 [Sinorhizobium alkalisoli]